MTLVRRPSPFGELVSLRQAMDRLFEDSFVSARSFNGSQGVGLPLDVTRESDALVIEAAMPGIRPEDVDITVEDGTLTIRAEYRDERTEGEGEVLLQEIKRGSSARSISLPSGLEPDKANATFDLGVLTLRIPKAEAVKPRQIRISATTDGKATNGSGAETSTGDSATDQGQGG